MKRLSQPGTNGRIFRAARITAAALAFGITATNVHAASATWSATPTDSNWVTTSSENNWSTGTGNYPGSISSLTNGDTATFSSGTSTQLSITINSPTLNIGNITFSGSSQPTYTIGSTSGNSLFLSNGGSISNTATGSSGTAIVNAPLVLEPASATTAGTYSFSSTTTSSSHLLSIGGSVTGGQTSAGIALTLTAATAGLNNTISGNISDGNAAGFVSISKTGLGNWILSGSDSYSGGTSISAGLLQINAASALTTTGTVNVSTNGAELLLYNQSTTTINATATYGGTSQSLILNGSGTVANSGAVRVDAALGDTLNATWAGTVTLGSTSKITTTTGNSLNFTGNVTDGGNTFQKQGTGTVTLSGTGNNLTGTLAVGNGTLVLANASGAAVSGTSTGVTVTIASTGTLQMGATNQFNATTPAPVTLTGVSGTGKAATFSVNGYSQGSTMANGVGALTLTSSSANNVVDFNSKNGVVTFASFTPNGTTLTVNNYLNNNGASGGPDELIFNQDQGPNGQNDLGSFVFTGYGATTEAALGNGFYEVFPTAVPEPATVFSGCLMIGLLGWSQRRQLRGLAGSMRKTLAA